MVLVSILAPTRYQFDSTIRAGTCRLSRAPELRMAKRRVPPHETSGKDSPALARERTYSGGNCAAKFCFASVPLRMKPMLFDITRLPEATSALRRALRDTGKLANELSHNECQEVLARAAGHSNLHSLKAHIGRPRFSERHTPYLTGDVDELVDLIQRKAVFDERREFEAKFGKAESWLTLYLRGARRMQAQCDYVRRGQLRVRPALADALHRSRAVSVSTLHEALQITRDAFEKQLWAWNRGDTASQAYDRAYGEFRLAALSLYLAEADAVPRQRKLEALAAQHVDIFTYSGAVLADRRVQATLESLGDDALNRHLSVIRHEGNVRVVGKAVTLQLYAGSKLSQPALSLYRIQAPDNLEELEKRWHALFPEIRAWHTWLEMKAPFASDADAVWANYQ